MDGFDAHVIVHSFLHKCCLCKRLGLVSDLHRVESDDLRQMKQHKSLVVAKCADRVFAVVKITKTTTLKGG